MTAFSWYAIPPNVTDSGPDTRTVDEPGFDDLCTYAEDELRDARRLYRDDKVAQRKLRLECLLRAQEHVKAAAALLEAEA